MNLSDKIKLIFKIVFFVLVIGTMGMFWYDEITYYLFDEDETLEWCPQESNVAAIKIQGDIVGYENEVQDEYIQTSAESIVNFINDINQIDNIKAIIVEIDSPGGYLVPGEEICNALKRTEKSTIAVIKDIGASSAYMIASGTDIIYASKYSEVGSIGVTMSYLDYSEQNKYEGITYQQLSSGEFKKLHCV